ncbi:hypothetical protein H310_13743 [Aphanomyces invadans]|uniref:Uncharacterized protein n=1 Tax=Aphanomyces invadans TaxID=157072 RepID=A0A024TBX6_9STRA|nr:hypothetical protein H310_13743 [Aphanomyces invadans]ETV91665.1 hypothetical protein H310_13743 [Aphanomyces invadans]|eukprot:XP_008879591.1 hypothetical protein H310_13743 [Aphanomyces invadans]
MPRQCFAAYLRQHCTSNEWQAACIVMLRWHQELLVALGVVEAKWANVPSQQGVQVVHSSRLTDTIRYRATIAGSFDELQRHVETSNVLPLLALPPDEMDALSLVATTTQHPLLLHDSINDNLWVQWHEECMHTEACPVGIATLTLSNHCWMDHGRIELTPDWNDAFTVVALLYSPGPHDTQRNNATTQVILCARVSAMHSEMVATAWREAGNMLTRNMVQLRLMAAWSLVPLAASGNVMYSAQQKRKACSDCGQYCSDGITDVCMGCLMTPSRIVEAVQAAGQEFTIRITTCATNDWTMPESAVADDAMAFLLSLVPPAFPGSKAAAPACDVQHVGLGALKKLAPAMRCRCLVGEFVPHFEVNL